MFKWVKPLYKSVHIMCESELHRIVNLTEYRIYLFMKNFRIPNSIRSLKFFEYRIPNIFVHEEFPNSEYRIVFVHEKFLNTEYIRSWNISKYRTPNSVCSWKFSEYRKPNSIYSWNFSNMEYRIVFVHENVPELSEYSNIFKYLDIFCRISNIRIQISRSIVC